MLLGLSHIHTYTHNTGSHFGRIVSGKPPFEELALLLVESGEPEALQVFLQTKLQVTRQEP